MNLFTSTLQNIKTQIQDIIDSTESKNEKGKIIFELSQYLNEYQKEHGLAHLDSRIYSENIIKSLLNDPTDFFRPIDYQYNFLIFLINNYSAEKELNEYINEFIDKFNKEFTAKDIEITATGATRCRTNIRFAVNDLRDLGLIGSKDKSGKRTMRPTFLGLLLVYYLHQDAFHKQSKKERLNKIPGSLIHHNSYRSRYGASGKYDTNLIDGIRHLNAIENQQKILNNIQNEFFEKELDDDIINKFINTLSEYQNFVLKHTKQSEDPTIIKTKVGKQALEIINRFEGIHPSNYTLQNNEKIRVKSIPVSGFEVRDRPVDWPGNQE